MPRPPIQPPQPDISLSNTPGGGYSMSTTVAPMQQATPPSVTLPTYTPPPAQAANNGWDDFMRQYMLRMQQAQTMQKPTGFGVGGVSAHGAAAHLAPDNTQQNMLSNQMAQQQLAQQAAQARAGMAQTAAGNRINDWIETRPGVLGGYMPSRPIPQNSYIQRG